MKIGLLREEKKILDHRVVLTPKQCKWINQNMNLNVVAQSSDISCFKDQEYLDIGVKHFSVGTDISILKSFWQKEGEEIVKSLEGK